MTTPHPPPPPFPPPPPTPITSTSSKPPPHYVYPTSTRTSNGLVNLTHLTTLTPAKLSQLDTELVAHCRTKGSTDWLRGYGFFVSWDWQKYAERGAAAGRARKGYAGGVMDRTV